MPISDNSIAVMRAAQELTFDEWLKVSRAITRAFVEQEHANRQGLKVNNLERIKYFYKIP